MPIRLVVGLGNPGPQYEETRHNVGFWFVDDIARAQGSSWTSESRFQSLMAKAQAGQIWLAKPQTFMNASGAAVGAIARFYRLEPRDILVVHDELDLMPGDVRIKQGGGHGGHNGVRDIATELASPDFWRLRIGIGHPRTLSLQQAVADFVLHRPRPDEEAAMRQGLTRCMQALPSLLGADMAAAQRTLHTSSKPADPTP